jgi:hypothetical protein
MSWIDSTVVEKCITDASMDQIEEALINNKYKVIRTRMQITATHGGTWSTNGKFSTIIVIDCGNYRECEDTETSKGWAMRPKTGVLAKIIQEAERIGE